MEDIKAGDVCVISEIDSSDLHWSQHGEKVVGVKVELIYLGRMFEGHWNCRVRFLEDAKGSFQKGEVVYFTYVKLEKVSELVRLGRFSEPEKK